jgi:hypothetical protein
MASALPRYNEQVGPFAVVPANPPTSLGVSPYGDSRHADAPRHGHQVQGRPAPRLLRRAPHARQPARLHPGQAEEHPHRRHVYRALPLARPHRPRPRRLHQDGVPLQRRRRLLLHGPEHLRADRRSSATPSATPSSTSRPTCSSRSASTTARLSASSCPRRSK